MNRQTVIQAWKDFSKYVKGLRKNYLLGDITIEEYRVKEEIEYVKLMKEYGVIK